MTLVWTPGWNGLTEPEAVSYVAAVEAADGQPLEFATAKAINDFVVGCKADGIWTAVKASCILAGARTLAGALVPLAGTAPTNNNFVSGNYNRKTGLVGDGNTKYLNSSRANNADPQNSQHMAVWQSTGPTSDFMAYMGDIGSSLGSSYFYRYTGAQFPFASRAALGGEATQTAVTPASNSMLGMSRSSSPTFIYRLNNTNYTAASIPGGTDATSATPSTGDIHVFRTNRTSGSFLYSNARLAFYSIGESLDLALLDTRVTALINAFAAAIP